MYHSDQTDEAFLHVEGIRIPADGSNAEIEVDQTNKDFIDISVSRQGLENVTHIEVEVVLLGVMILIIAVILLIITSVQVIEIMMSDRFLPLPVESLLNGSTTTIATRIIELVLVLDRILLTQIHPCVKELGHYKAYPAIRIPT